MTTPRQMPEAVIDVRAIVPRARHPSNIFLALKPGQVFVLVNDHDQKLHRQFQAGYAGAFRWDHLEQGPDVRRVRIGR